MEMKINMEAELKKRIEQNRACDSTIKFSDASDKIYFEYHATIPGKKIQFSRKAKASEGRSLKLGSLNLGLLKMYGLYRNAVYYSYKLKEDLATDIRNYRKVFQEKETSALSNDVHYRDPLYHYSVAASLGAMQEWRDSEKMQSYLAYNEDTGDGSTSYENTGWKTKTTVGFVHFIEKKMGDKQVVYIAQAGVTAQGKGIGRRLMECVLTQYPEGTEFYILTRVFNTDAKNLYNKRLGFSPIELDEIRALGYDERYCGFKHITTSSEVEAMLKKMQRVEGTESSKDNGRACRV